MMKIIAVAVAASLVASPVASGTASIQYEKSTKMRDARNAMLIALGIALSATIMLRRRAHAT